MNKILILIVVILVLAGCNSQSSQGELFLPSLGPAQELENEVWINSDGPIRLADLRGQVILIDMWTFG